MNVAGVVAFALAGLFDLFKCEVPDPVWIPALIAVAAESFSSPWPAVAAIAALPLSVLALKRGSVGGADAIALPLYSALTVGRILPSLTLLGCALVLLATSRRGPVRVKAREAKRLKRLVPRRYFIAGEALNFPRSVDEAWDVLRSLPDDAAVEGTLGVPLVSLMALSLLVDAALPLA